MLQQTQVATVIAYWKRWIEKWPTIAGLAKADTEVSTRLAAVGVADMFTLLAARKSMQLGVCSNSYF
jgi:hypothetical protein